MQVPDSKSCPDCSTLLPAASFYRNDTHLDGFSTWCSKCETRRKIEFRTRLAKSLPAVLPAVKRCGGPARGCFPWPPSTRILLQKTGATVPAASVRRCNAVSKMREQTATNSWVTPLLLCLGHFTPPA